MNNEGEHGQVGEWARETRGKEHSSMVWVSRVRSCCMNKRGSTGKTENGQGRP